MHADFAPVREFFRPQVKEGIQAAGVGGSMAVAGTRNQGLRDAAAKALRAVIDEFDHLYDDLGSFTLEWVVGGSEGGMNVSSTVRMTGTRSFLSRVLLSDEDRMASAPDDFWKLPTSMTSASFTHARFSDEGKAIGAVVGELLLGAAREFDFPTKKLQRAVDLYGKVVAEYPDNDALVVSFPSTPGVFGEDWPEELRTQLDQLGIFMIGGHKVANDIPMFKAWVEVYNDRAMQKKLASFMPDGKSLPKLKWSKVPAKDKLPKGSYEVRLTFPKGWLPKDGSIKSLPQMSVMMVPVGDRLWYATSFDRKGMVAALRAVANPSGPTLAEDPAAQRFRSQKVAHGAWTKVEQSIVDDIIDGLLEEEDDPDKAAKMRAAHDSWSAKWKTESMPAMTSWSVVDGLTWRSDLRLERETTRAYIDLFAQLVREFAPEESPRPERGRSEGVPGGVPGGVPAGKSRFGDKK
jgi:hypothetical protein